MTMIENDPKIVALLFFHWKHHVGTNTWDFFLNESRQTFLGEKRLFPTALTHQAWLFWCNTIFQPNHLKANDQSISEHLHFSLEPFQFTAPKKVISPYFLCTKTTFSR